MILKATEMKKKESDIISHEGPRKLDKLISERRKKGKSFIYTQIFKIGYVYMNFHIKIHFKSFTLIHTGKLLPFTVDMYRGRTLGLTLWGDNSKISNNYYDNNYDGNHSKNDNNYNYNEKNSNIKDILPPLHIKNKHWKSILDIGDEIYIANVRFKIVEQAIPTGMFK